MANDYNDIFKGNVDFQKSKTRENLMRAFAGESQARNRYQLAAGVARSGNLEVVARVFEFTAEQEKAHAKVFYNFLKDCSGQNIQIDGTYPVDIFPNVLSYLRAAQHNEYQEWEHDYASFAKVAQEEGFQLLGKQFEMIAGIEHVHGDRFGQFADWLEQGKLFLADSSTSWMCLNCGQIIHAEAAPGVCPVCRHNQCFFVRLELAPFTGAAK